ncbi:MAG: pyridoxal-phosphate dependent enzyme [Patescibacteria group bacterium]
MNEAILETKFSERLKEREETMCLRDCDLVGLNRAELYRRLKAVIGNSPIHQIDLPNGNILLQVNETRGLSESHYDRVFIPLLESLEEDGKIERDSDVLETSSGNAGISFAWAARKLRFNPYVFMPDYVPEPRIIETQRMAGHEQVVLIDDKKKFLKACSDAMVKHLRGNRDRVGAEGRKIWMANHSQNNIVPGFFAPIAQEARRFAGAIDYFIGGIGNGSTVLGIGEDLKRHSPDTKVIGFEPHRAATYFQRERVRWGNFTVPILGEGEAVHTEWSFHDLPGIGGSGNINMPFIERAIQDRIMDDIVPVDEKSILSTVRYNEELKPEERLGNSSLVARAIAEKMALDVRDKTFLTLAYDRTDRYGKPQYTPSK